MRNEVVDQGRGGTTSTKNKDLAHVGEFLVPKMRTWIRPLQRSIQKEGMSLVSFGTALAYRMASSNFATLNYCRMTRSFSLGLSLHPRDLFRSPRPSDLVLFSDDGVKFTFIVDGDVKNAEPASRVVATGIRTETPVMMVKFEDAAITPSSPESVISIWERNTP